MADQSTEQAAAANDGNLPKVEPQRVAWGIVTLVLAVLVLRGASLGGGAVDADEANFVKTLLEVKDRVETGYVRQIEPDVLRQAAIEGMLRLTTDDNTGYIPPAEAESFNNALGGVYVGIGVNILAVNADDDAFTMQQPSGGIRVTRVLPKSPALDAGLKTGDILVSADGIDIRPLTVGEAQDYIMGPAGTDVTIGVERDGTDLTFDITRASVESPVLEGIARKDDGSPRFLIEAADVPAEVAFGSGELPRVAYVRLEQFTPNCTAKVANVLLTLEPLDGVLLDLRQNPGGQLTEAVGLASLFLDDGKLVTFEDGRNAARTLHRVGRPDDLPQWLTTVPLALLVDGSSASASEIVAGALSHHGRATLVGQDTFGKGSVQIPLPIGGPDGRFGFLRLTEAFYHLPDGRIVDRTGGVSSGVEVDVDVPLAEGEGSRPEQDGPIWPRQVWRAYEVLLVDLLQPTGRGDVVEPAVIQETL
ncbi:MAG: S41 family peptidase [Planctomycetota bacterium]